MRRTRENLVRLAYVLLLFVVSFFPARVAYLLAKQLGRWRYSLDSSRLTRLKQYMAERMRASDADATRWLRSAYEFMAFEDLEVWLLPRLTKETLDRALVFEGLENLRAALDRGKGAILYGAHIRSMYSMFISLGLLGLPISVLVRKKPNNRRSWVDQWFYAKRIRHFESVGDEFVSTYPPDPFLAARCTRLLRQNRILLVSIDARPAQADDVEVEFLNEVKTFSLGPAMMAKASGASLLDYSVRRLSADAPAHVRIGEPLLVTGDLVEATRAQARRVEETIRADPSGWNLWFDRVDQRRVMRWLAQFVPDEDRTTMMKHVRSITDASVVPDSSHQT